MSLQAAAFDHFLFTYPRSFSYTTVVYAGDLLLSDLISKRDNLSVCCELLLRIDSMVISGLIGTQEASDLRRMVVDDKLGIIDVFSNIEGKKDTELLSQLHHFSDKSKR